MERRESSAKRNYLEMEESGNREQAKNIRENLIFAEIGCQQEIQWVQK
jgi:hypothetical protein